MNIHNFVFNLVDKEVPRNFFNPDLFCELVKKILVLEVFLNLECWLNR